MADGERAPRIQVTDSMLVPERGRQGIFSAWRITFFGAVFFLVLLPLAWPDPYWRILRFVYDGLGITFTLTISAILLSTILGLLVGLGQISRNTVINRLVTIYVEIIRGIPLMVQLFFVYFGLGALRLDGLFSAVIAFTVCYSAYMGEIFRAGIQAIPRGQMEAALALGMSRNQAIRFVIVPQTLRIVLPALGNEFIAMLKDSSMVSAVALSDILRRGREFQQQSFLVFETYTMIALVFLVLTLFLSRIVGLIEERMHRDGS